MTAHMTEHQFKDIKNRLSDRWEKVWHLYRTGQMPKKQYQAIRHEIETAGRQAELKLAYDPPKQHTA